MSNIESVNNLNIELYELLKNKQIFNDSYGYFFLNKWSQKIHITGERKRDIEVIRRELDREKPKRELTETEKQTERELLIKYTDAPMKDDTAEAERIERMIPKRNQTYNRRYIYE
jgi:hypothetical protein